MNITKQRVALAIGVCGMLAAVGCGASTTTKTVAVPGPTVTKTVPVPGETKDVAVPGPTKTIIRTKTVTVQAPPPAPGGVITTFHGSGNEATPSFNVPASGNYTVAWTFSGNVDTSLGTDQPTNFAISNTGSGVGLGLANDIAASGHGSTEVTGGSSTDSFNVQAGDSSSWTLTVTAA